jgi:spermidine synthase
VEDNSTKINKTKSIILLGSLLVLSACAILYELLISTVSTYLLGSSVLHFSITIGLFLSFLGVGAYLSRFLSEPLLPKFIIIEILLSVMGGCSAAILYIGNAWFDYYYPLLFLTVGAVGTLAGMEIPLVTRLLERDGTLRELIARVLAFDYLGALVASLVFPLLLLPLLGTMRTAFFTGMVNWAVALFNYQVFSRYFNDTKKPIALGLAVSGIILLVGFFGSYKLVSFSDAMHYQDRVVFAHQTPYQRIIVTKWNNDVRLFLNGNLQFSSVDEYRYHEALVHPAMLAAGNIDSVLVLGGGDGMALRELLKYPQIKSVELVDLDVEMVRLARTHPLFTRLNGHLLDDPRVHLVYDDAFQFIKNATRRYNVIIIDLPDPSEPVLGKLYSTAFYSMIRQILTPDGVVVTQSTSPFLARKPFWCIHHTMRTALPNTLAYQAYVPSFGQWGFQLATPAPIPREVLIERIRSRLAEVPDRRYLTPENLPGCFVFDADNGPLDIAPNTLETMDLVTYYEASFVQFH